MTTHAWLIYLTLVLVATATPGPAVLYITTSSLLHGWRKAAFAALGNISGLFCLGIVAVTGLGAIIGASVAVFNLIKYAGAAYLVYLGIRLFRQKGPDAGEIEKRLAQGPAAPRKIYFQAMGVALSNPKAIVFLTALFPQFISVHEPLAPQFLTLIATLMAFSFTFLMGYALLAHRVRIWLATAGRSSAVRRTGGAVFIGFGLLLAVSSSN